MRLSRNTRRHTQFIVVALCAAAVGLAGGATVSDAAAGKATSAPQGPLFSAQSLMPGQTITAHFSVPAVNVAVPASLEPVASYLQAVHVHDGCTSQGCTARGPKLSRHLLLRVIAADGTTQTWTPGELISRQVLPGLPARGNGSATYAVTMRLPSRDTNDYANRTVNMDFQWGLMDANGNPLPKVLGESITRKPTSGAGLPFTGAATFDELVAGGLLIGGGLLLLFAVRRRRSTDEY